MANIRFVRAYEFYGNPYYDVIYGAPGRPSRVYTYSKESLPKTVTKWLEGKEGITQHNSIFDRDEVIYKAGAIEAMKLCIASLREEQANER